jgi:hypothetical protein
MREPPVELAAKTLSTKLLSCAQHPATWTFVASVEAYRTQATHTNQQPDGIPCRFATDGNEAINRSFFADFGEACRAEFRMFLVTASMLFQC